MPSIRRPDTLLDGATKPPLRPEADSSAETPAEGSKTPRVSNPAAPPSRAGRKSRHEYSTDKGPALGAQPPKARGAQRQTKQSPAPVRAPKVPAPAVEIEHNEADVWALYTQWSSAPLIDAMTQLAAWMQESDGLHYGALALLCRDSQSPSILTRWLGAPTLAAQQAPAYMQALQMLIDHIGPLLPASFVMAQLEAKNTFLAAYSEHHALLELLQSQLHHGRTLAPHEHLAALLTASFRLACGHTDPAPGWVQIPSWLAAVRRLVRSEATDASFVAMLARLGPYDVHTMWHLEVRTPPAEHVVPVLLAWPGSEALLATSDAWRNGFFLLANARPDISSRTPSWEASTYLPKRTITSRSCAGRRRASSCRRGG